ncbi:unnamed protein product [Lymnaea stagnalis]|uniref:Uncharacterized protein n=1 Tax=Lymnaea stagnalis TaxID=6523 RepID=A0AAV2HB20_LYMST
MAQAKYNHPSDNQEIKLHYDMLIADHYNVNISFDYQANSAVAIARIITVLCTSEKGADVELHIQKKNNEITFVRYNLPALKTEELKDIKLEIYHKPDGPSGAESHYSSLQRPKLKRKIKVLESKLTTHTTLMFVIDVEQEIFKGYRRKKQSVLYFYTNSPVKQQIDQELKETGLCTEGMTPLSPSLSLAPLTWMPLENQREPLCDIRVLPHHNLSDQALGRAANQVNMMYGLLLADHYQLNTSAEFMTNSDEAVVRVLTRIETTPTGSEVDIQFQKRNRQVSFVRFELKDLKTIELKDFEVDIKYKDPEGHRRGNCYTRLYSQMKNVNKKLTIPKSDNTTQIKVAFIFNVSVEGCTEPQVLYIYTKDHLDLPLEALPTSDGIKKIKSLDFAVPVNSRVVSGIQQSTDRKEAVLKNRMSEILGPENSEPHVGAVPGQSFPIKKNRRVSIIEDDKRMAVDEPLADTDKSKLAEATAGNAQGVYLGHVDLSKPDNGKPGLKPTVEKFKFHEKSLTEHIKKAIVNCVRDFFPDDEQISSFFSGEVSLSMETTKHNKNVTLSTFNINNNFTFNMSGVENAVVGHGNINISNNCKSPND